MPRGIVPDDGEGVTAWRLGELEKTVAELVKAFQSSTSALGSQITALSNQIGNGLASLPEHYSPRREAEERHSSINERFLDHDRRFADYEKALEQRFILRDKALDEREKRLSDRITANTRLIQRIEGAGWGLAAGLLLALAGAAIALLKP